MRKSGELAPIFVPARIMRKKVADRHDREPAQGGMRGRGIHSILPVNIEVHHSNEAALRIALTCRSIRVSPLYIRCGCETRRPMAAGAVRGLRRQKISPAEIALSQSEHKMPFPQHLRGARRLHRRGDKNRLRIALPNGCNISCQWSKSKLISASPISASRCNRGASPSSDNCRRRHPKTAREISEVFLRAISVLPPSRARRIFPELRCIRRGPHERHAAMLRPLPLPTPLSSNATMIVGRWYFRETRDATIPRTPGCQPRAPRTIAASRDASNFSRVPLPPVQNRFSTFWRSRFCASNSRASSPPSLGRPLSTNAAPSRLSPADRPR